jgi:murein DD-endopeptidase MepM/ murein hydrolase activator NlpD
VSRRARLLAVLAPVVAGAVAVPSAAYARVPVTDYTMPFTCGQAWTGDSRPTHSPSALSIDWNRDGDLGKRVIAPAPGVITRVENLGSRSYGLYVILDHGNGETTLYAHLSAEYVTVGQRVDTGEVIAAVGSSGGSTGPHLHFEERRNGTDVQPYFDGVAFTFGSSLASKNCPDVPVVGDWNNDGTDDLGTFSRRVYGWFNLLKAGQVTRARRGLGADRPLVGDFDGDGRTDLGVRRATTPDYVLRLASGEPAIKLRLGAVDDKPLVGDWDGNGTTDIGLWRPATGMFWMRWPNGSVRKVQLGSTSQLPVTGDWNGDGTTDLGVFDPTTATWSLRMVGKDGTVWTGTTRLGAAGDLPVAGDWNGDGTTDLGTWTPSTATWNQRYAATATSASPRMVSKVFGTAR